MTAGKKWPWGLLGCGTLFLLCVTCVWLNEVLQERPPQRNFRIDDLLIGEGLFPPGWRLAEGPYTRYKPGPLGGGPNYLEYREVFFRVVQSDTGVYAGAIHEIFRFVSAREAAREFDRRSAIVFPTTKYWSPWETPKEFGYQSAFADRFRVACARHGPTLETSTEVCEMLGQYEEYLVRLSVDINPSLLMTYADFERIVQAIDERMGYYLGKGPVRPTP